MKLLEDLARAAVDFDVALPAELPPPWRLAEVDTVPGSRSMVTLVFAAGDGRGFRVHQRLRVVSLLEELRITGQQGRVFRSGGQEVHVVEGAFVGSGEPIDGMYRHMGRQELFWEVGDVIGQLEFRVGVDAETDDMLEIVASMSTAR